jgi:hypothetical protein
MKIGLPQSKKAIRLLYGFGGAMLLIAGGSGVVLGEERADPEAASRSALYEAVITGDDAGAGLAQQLLDVARERIAKQQGLTEAERRVRLTALEDSMGIYTSMIGRLREIKMRDPDLGSVEAKTLLKSASVVVERLEERGQAPVPLSPRTLASEGMKGLALLGLLSLLAGAALSFPIGRTVWRPFKALAALVAANRAA